MNPMDLLKNIGNVQEKFNEYQEKLLVIKVTGVAGGDMVKIVISGDMSISDIYISKDAMELNDAEALQDLVKAAHADAMAKLKVALSEQVGGMGFNIPPGFTP